MQRPPALDRNRIGKAGLALLVFHLGDIDIVVGPEDLRLLTQLHLVEIEGKLPTAAEPRVVSQQGGGTVVGMGVDWPVGEDHIGPLGQEDLTKFFVPAHIHFRMTINLV